MWRRINKGVYNEGNLHPITNLRKTPIKKVDNQDKTNDKNIPLLPLKNFLNILKNEKKEIQKKRAIKTNQKK